MEFFKQQVSFGNHLAGRRRRRSRTNVDGLGREDGAGMCPLPLVSSFSPLLFLSSITGGPQGKFANIRRKNPRKAKREFHACGQYKNAHINVEFWFTNIIEWLFI